MAPPHEPDTNSMPTLPRSLVALAAAAWLSTLAACPQERPGAEREIPPQRVPPAVVVEPQPSVGAPLSADGGVTRRP